MRRQQETEKRKSSRNGRESQLGRGIRNTVLSSSAEKDGVVWL